MCEKIPAAILSESEQTVEVLRKYLDEFGKFVSMTQCCDLSEIFNTLSSIQK